MNCLKCGRQVQEGQTFCPDCLAEMERSPVKPGTPVHLPNRAELARRAAPKKRPVSPEEQLLRLKRMNRRLWISLAAALAALVIALGTLALVWPEQVSGPDMGRNYSTAGSPRRP